MGSHHKLMLTWQGRTIIERVLEAWTQSIVDQVVVVVRQDDQDLQRACEQWSGVELLIPEEDPEDMKRSIQLGLRRIEDRWAPRDTERWITAPADLPTINTALIDRVVGASRSLDSIVVPRFGGRRGHPVAFPWTLVPKISCLGPDQGINKLLEEHWIHWLDLPSGDRPTDIDTPDDFRRLLEND
jgi:molybdenum cofactor cytidylyltransferase